MKKKMCLGVIVLLSVAIMKVPALALEEGYKIEGNVRLKKSSEIYNVNPYNPQKITATGEDGSLVLITQEGKVVLPLSRPLYAISNGYSDKVKYDKGAWGVERNVGQLIFDGSEDWQLVREEKYNNTNSTIFMIDLNEKIKIKEGISTHFEVKSDKEQRANIYDGISISRDGTKCYMRIMNVRNVKTVEALKQYLTTQKDNQNPVMFLYGLPESIFEVFSEEVQTKLKGLQSSQIGFIDTVIPKSGMTELPKTSSYFRVENTYQNGDLQLRQFAGVVKSIKLYNGNVDKKYWIESIGIDTNKNECSITIASEGENEEAVIVSKGVISFYDCDFSSGKPTEMILESVGENGVSAILQINFSGIKIPTQSFLNLTYEDTGLSKAVIAVKQLVMPARVPIVEGIEMSVYYDNVVLNGELKKNDIVRAVDSDGKGEEEKNRFQFTISKEKEPWHQSFVLEDTASGDTKTATVEVIPVSKEAGSGVTKKIMFLGDSLIDQNYMVEAITKLFSEDEMKLSLVGTRGQEDMQHEGRGGWSAYDYCTASTQYGVTNPFLNNGKFDFSYFMEKNKFESIDSVFISLGVNDLNQTGHNTQEEILKNFDTMIKSIQNYNGDIDIMLGLPPMLYAKDSTFMAKNTRLAFIQKLIEVYGQKEENGIFLVPLYINIDPFMSFKFEQPVISNDNPSGAMVVTDTTHPRIKGYEQMADTIYSYIKYIEANKK